MLDFFILPSLEILLVCLVAVMIVGISKSGLGGGLSFLGVPLLSIYVSPILAIAVMLPILCLIDIFTIRKFWGKWSWSVILGFLPFAFLGIIAGSFVINLLDFVALKGLIGVLSVFFALQYFLSKPKVPHSGQKNKIDRSWRRILDMVLAFCCGVVSTLAHVGGPFVSMYILPKQLDKTVLVSSVAFIFLLVNVSKIVPYTFLDLFSAESLSLSLLMVPVVPVSVALGVWLHNNLRNDIFYKLSYIAVFTLGMKLIFDTLAAYESFLF